MSATKLILPVANGEEHKNPKSETSHSIACAGSQRIKLHCHRYTIMHTTSFNTRNRFRFHRGYFSATVILFITEVLIAVFVHDNFVRPYIGDVLVVILIYCAIRSFFDTPPIATAVGVLIFSFVVETLQYFRIVEILGWQESKLARVVIGTSFALEDLVAYMAGIIVVILVEKKIRKSTG